LVRNRWRRSLTLEEAVAELKQGASSQFDPDVVAAMLQALEQDTAIANLALHPYSILQERPHLGHPQTARVSPAAQAAMTVQNTQLHLRVEETLRLLAATKSHTELILDSLPEAVFT